MTNHTVVKHEMVEVVRMHYSNANTTAYSVNKLLEMLKEKLNLDPRQILHADSICSDDVNSIEYPQRAYDMLGPFKMGGLNGFPFAGVTGMNAFAHHVPEDGAVVIFYAPRIGITEQGEIGQVHRIGQTNPSACCGAAKGALDKLQANQIVKGIITELDYQQNFIEQLFYRHKDHILQATIPIKEATEVMYEAIEERMNILASKTKFTCRFLILAGGIFINGDPHRGSFCSFKRVEVIDLETGNIKNLLGYIEQ